VGFGLSERVTTFGKGGTRWSDPNMSLSHRFERDGRGFQFREGLSLTVPTTERSHNDGLYTRATCRVSLNRRTETGWSTNMGLSYSRPFYKDIDKVASAKDWGASPPSAQTQSDPSGATRSNGGDRRGGGGRGGRGNRPGRGNSNLVGSSGSSSEQTPQQVVDSVLRETERDRTTGSVGLTYSFPRHWKIGTGGGISYVQTSKDKAVWATSARVLGVSYKVSNVEMGSDLQVFSDAGKFKHPSLPKYWGVGLHLSLAFGGRGGGETSEGEI
jgi:hypothetical protein